MVALCAEVFKGETPGTDAGLRADGSPNGPPPALVRLLNKCWSLAPSRRPTAAAIVAELDAIIGEVTREANVAQAGAGGQ